MAIQTRRGDHSEFDPEKLLPGEWACVTKGDPDSSDGKSVYMCFEAGVVKRMSTYEDMKRDIKEATQDIQDEFLSEIQQATDSANTAAQSANQAAEDANQAAGLAKQAARAANEAAEAIEEAVSGVINDNQASTVTTYSSSKIDEKLQQQTTESVIDDSTTSDTKTFSSQKISNLIGALSSLTTEQRSNLVAAINELVGRIDDQDTHIDDFDQRLTNEENQVDFIADTIIGDRDNLTTTNRSSIVSAVNEVNGKVLKGTYTIPKPGQITAQEITIDTGMDMTGAFVVIDCMEKTISDVPQFLMKGRTKTGFSFTFLPGGTSRSYPCTWIAVF